MTGNEPRAARLDEEPYWNDLTQLVDWAKESDSPSLWSCLAAHGAVLHLDGIERRRLPQKKSGVLAAAVNQPRRHGLPDALSVCHSRMNELRKDELTAHGYGIVSEAPGGNVDIFTKTYRAPFLFLQGHPEYDADSLMREYRRDVGRYLNGLRDTYPEIPENYFDNATVIAMENYRTAGGTHARHQAVREPSRTRSPQGLAERLAQSASQIFKSWVGNGLGDAPVCLNAVPGEIQSGRPEGPPRLISTSCPGSGRLGQALHHARDRAGVHEILRRDHVLRDHQVEGGFDSQHDIHHLDRREACVREARVSS